MPGLTTHILDTTRGQPAAGVRLELFAFEGGERQRLREVTTNRDGRTDEPLLDGDAMRAGRFEILFHVGGYFDNAQGSVPNGGFLDQVPVRFTITDPSRHYHVPLLVSPWSYTTYRGS